METFTDGISTQTPFEVALNQPNRESLEALAEVREMKQHPERYKGYTDAEAMMKELLA